MPTNDLFVDRLVNGAQSNEFQTDIPDGFEVVLVPGEGHTHVIYGDPDELVAAGLKKPKPARKPAAKKPAAKKPAAKKPAARKTASKK